MPSLTGFLLLPLLGGFFFLYFCNRTRFTYRKLEGHRLFFPAAIWGLVFFALARVMTLFLAGTAWGDSLRRPLKAFAGFEYSGAAVGALLLGLLLAGASNLHWRQARMPDWLTRLWDGLRDSLPLESNKEQALLAVARQNDELLYLLLQAQKEGRQILLVLENGKAYAGYVLFANLAPDLPYVKLLPVVSGYRSKETLDLELTTVYKKVMRYLALYERWKDLPPSSLTRARQDRLGERLRRLQVVLKRDKILSASFFDRQLYSSHQRERHQQSNKLAA